MKLKHLFLAAVVTLVGSVSFAAETPAAASPVAAELKTLLEKVAAKLQNTEARNAEALAAELKEFEALEAKYADQKTNDVAQIHFMHALLYVQVLNDFARAKELFARLHRDFPATELGAKAGEAVAELERLAKRVDPESLAGKAAPDITFTWSTDKDLKKLSDLKGKVVVIDFWATWCGPCVASFPDVRKLTAHYKDSDVVVLGVTSLQGRVMGLPGGQIDTRGDPAKEHALMSDYVEAKDITWTVAFSEEEVFNPEYGVTGIPHMVIVAPDGTVRHPSLDPRDPHEEKVAKIDALLKEFGKPVAKK